MIVHGHVPRTRFLAPPSYLSRVSGGSYAERRAHLLQRIARLNAVMAGVQDETARNGLQSAHNMLVECVAYCDARLAAGSK